MLLSYFPASVCSYLFYSYVFYLLLHHLSRNDQTVMKLRIHSFIITSSLLFAPLLFPRVDFRKDAFARKVLRSAADLTLLNRTYRAPGNATCEHSHWNQGDELQRGDWGKDKVWLHRGTKTKVASRRKERAYYSGHLSPCQLWRPNTNPLLATHNQSLLSPGPQLINQLKNPHKATVV